MRSKKLENAILRWTTKPIEKLSGINIDRILDNISHLQILQVQQKHFTVSILIEYPVNSTIEETRGCQFDNRFIYLGMFLKIFSEKLLSKMKLTLVCNIKMLFCGINIDQNIVSVASKVVQSFELSYFCFH